MADDRETIRDTGNDAAAQRKGGGVLPDGIRGTTRDTGHTIPQDEHAGYQDPTKPAPPSETDRT
ncbi:MULTISPECIES: hypothetical protein [Paracoccus]|uniref:Uncharacterized protein n=1 Tax=Paracoccus fontiphilus TaxID=1815556 RepID=A0ABV7IDP3_9RHOB|nr:hypothetical protein [Paracoccus fontiphilus]